LPTDKSMIENQQVGIRNYEWTVDILRQAHHKN